MILIDFEQQFLVRTEVDPLLQRVQELIPVGPEYVICLVVSLPQRITPQVKGSVQGVKDERLAPAELPEALRQAVPIGPIDLPVGQSQYSADQSLDALLEHRAIIHRQQLAADVDMEVRIDADQIGVERRMVQLGEWQSIGHHGLAPVLTAVCHDMCRIQ